MPFTPSHIAAALPFIRTPLLPAAVVVGTMTPDIPYYVPLFVPRDFSHGALGAMTIDPAMGILTVLLWWFVLREPIIDLLPRSVGARIPEVGRTAWRRRGWGWPRTIATLLLSVVLGIATHLLWDSFTHAGWLVDHLAILRATIGPLPLDKWLQHLSTVIGLVIVAIWVVRWLRSAPVDIVRPTRQSRGSRIVAESAFFAAGVFSGMAIWVHGMATGSAAFDPNLVFLVARVGIGAALAAALILVILWYTVRLAPRRHPESRPTLAP